MIHYNDELKEFHSKVARKKHLEVVLQDLWAQEQELVPKVAELEQIKMDEQEDVERLEGGSLAAFFYSVVGKMDEKLDKERQEAYMASVKFDAAVRQLETVEYEIEKSEKELEELQGCEERYEQLLKEKLEILKSATDSVAAEILQLEESIQHINNQKREIEEAVSAGDQALKVAKDVQSSLKSADGWSTFDMLGGGWIASMAKHEHLDEAQHKVELLQIKLRKFRTELADVKISADMKVSIDGFTRFADFFFDGLFMDWMVADQISQSQKQVALTTLQIEEAIERLEKLQAKAEKDKEHLQKQLEELVVRS